MVALFTLLAVVTISIVMVRITTKALELTGLSEEVAHFQARSVFTGTGFTTHEAESVVDHPVRRRIIKTMMLGGNAGLVTAISTFILTFVETGSSAEMLQRGGMLVGGLLVLAYLAKNKWVERLLERCIEWALERYTDLKVKDYDTLLHLQGGYTVTRFSVNEDSWLAGKSLEDADLAEEGIMVLSLEEPDGSVRIPHGQDVIEPGTKLTLYGEESGFKEFSERLERKLGSSAQQEPEEDAPQEEKETASRKEVPA